jgi:peptidoglycan-N-acetylglucosamine deacetylase
MMDKQAAHLQENSRQKFFNKDFYLVTAPWWMRLLFQGCIWDIKTAEKAIYLTFDDGPHPVITPFVLKQLELYNAKATFFCIGDNVRRYPETYQQIIAAGHTVGNHTMHHLNGWKTADETYLADIAAAGTFIKSALFRPPYGRIKKSQLKAFVTKKSEGNTGTGERRVIMWSVLAGDWDVTITPQQCFNRVKKAVYPGSIIVFHDSEKADERMRYALPRLLEHYKQLGYAFKAIVS